MTSQTNLDLGDISHSFHMQLIPMISISDYDYISAKNLHVQDLNLSSPEDLQSMRKTLPLCVIWVQWNILYIFHSVGYYTYVCFCVQMRVCVADVLLWTMSEKPIEMKEGIALPRDNSSELILRSALLFIIRIHATIKTIIEHKVLFFKAHYVFIALKIW